LRREPAFDGIELCDCSGGFFLMTGRITAFTNQTPPIHTTTASTWTVRATIPQSTPATLLSIS